MSMLVGLGRIKSEVRSYQTVDGVIDVNRVRHSETRKVVVIGRKLQRRGGTRQCSVPETCPIEETDFSKREG